MDDPANGFRLLGAGRIDYFLTGYYAGQAIIIEKKLDREIVALLPFLAETGNAVGFVRSSPCAALRPEFDRVLDAMISSGEVTRILKRNLERWRCNPQLGR